MAFGVYYLADDGRPGWRSCGLYLKQPFYEAAHTLLGRDGLGPLLTKILTMGYGGNTLIRPCQSDAFAEELLFLGASLPTLPQLDALLDVARRAGNEGRALVISGDMYPELDKDLRHSLPIPRCTRCGARNKSPFWDVCSCGKLRVENG